MKKTLITTITILCLLFSCAESKSQKSGRETNAQNVAIVNNNDTLNQSDMQETHPIQAKNIKLQSIKLEHTNPSMGPHENIITISLANNPDTEARINQFLNAATINKVMSVGEYILAYRSNDEKLIQKVVSAKNDGTNLKEGTSISNLIFYFEDQQQPLKIKDVYRRYTITKFYDDFTKYMVENGSKNETAGSSKSFIEPKIQGFSNYSEKDLIIGFRQTPGGPGSTSYELKIFGDASFTYSEDNSNQTMALNNFPGKGNISKEIIDLIFAEAKRINYKQLTADCMPQQPEHDGQEIIMDLRGYMPSSSNDKCTNAKEINTFKNWTWNMLSKLITLQGKSAGNDTEKIASFQLPKVNRFISGYVKTSNYGGSTPIEGPSVRHYADYDVLKETNATTREEWYKTLENYLDNTMVNESITLRAYLLLQYKNDEAKLREIHAKQAPQEKGNVITYLPTLLFHGGLAEPTFVLQPNKVSLKGMGMSALNLFLEKHANIFSSELPEDEFYVKYFSKL